MRTILITFLITILVLAGGCAEAVEIRVANESGQTFDEVLVRFPGQEERYGPVPPGGRSEYREVGTAYSYAYVEVRIGSETLVLQPIDYLGATPLPGGRYTYVLDLFEGRSLTLELRTDG